MTDTSALASHLGIERDDLSRAEIVRVCSVAFAGKPVPVSREALTSSLLEAWPEFRFAIRTSALTVLENRPHEPQKETWEAIANSALEGLASVAYQPVGRKAKLRCVVCRTRQGHGHHGDCRIGRLIRRSAAFRTRETRGTNQLPLNLSTPRRRRTQ